MNSTSLKNAFENARAKSANLYGFKNPNSIRSTIFLEEICLEIMKNYDNQKYDYHCQKWDNKNRKKKSGEWLYDGVICEKHFKLEIGAKKPHGFKANIEWVIEAEFKTDFRECLNDFSKLLNACSKNKLYLNGYMSDNLYRFKEYHERRLVSIGELIMDFNKSGEFYYGFYPSPSKPNNSSLSFWNLSKNYLEILKLYKWDIDNQIFNLI